MRVLILGGDGYLGWPIAMSFANRGDDVIIVDNFEKSYVMSANSSKPLIKQESMDKRLRLFQELTGRTIKDVYGDCEIYDQLVKLIDSFQPDTIINCTNSSSATYSGLNRHTALATLKSKLTISFNVIWAIIEKCPTAHLIQFGDMGEYGASLIDIEEGWLNINHNGMSDKFLYPRQGDSLYHVVQSQITDMFWLYVRQYGLRVTNVMQGSAYGLITEESELDHRLLPSFYYDGVFGSALNRFVLQALLGIPLTIYGEGDQIRGFIDIQDVVDSTKLQADRPAGEGELRIINQITQQLSINRLAELIMMAGETLNLDVDMENWVNSSAGLVCPVRKIKYDKLTDLGLKPHLLNVDWIVNFMKLIDKYSSNADKKDLQPRTRWMDRGRLQPKMKWLD